MRKYIFIFLFANFYSAAHSQVIKGTIFDKQTKSTIPFAAVYFSGTFVGSSSDQNGNFQLDITNNASMPLTISAVGYYSFNITDFSIDEPFMIYLAPKIDYLQEIVISGKSLVNERNADLKLFRKAFLGKTNNARKCEIINENDITFNYGSDNDTLKAFALKPILIINKALGYSITYYLNKFEYYKKSKTMSFEGNIIFDEDLEIKETNKQVYKRRRKYAYLGSRMHFFRALWADDLESANFKIKDSVEENLKYNDVVIQEVNDKKFLAHPENLYVYYNTRISKININNECVFFDQDGFFDPSGIIWEGEMGRKRIADWLPYEYTIEN